MRQWANTFEEPGQPDYVDEWEISAATGTCDACEADKRALLRVGLTAQAHAGDDSTTLSTETDVCLACVVEELAEAVGASVLLELGRTMLEAAAGRTS